MIKLQIIGNLAHDNKLFDSTCRQCGVIYSRVKTAMCPNCGNAVVPITAKNGRAMMVSEGTIYPLTTEDQKEAEAKSRSKRKNSMEIIFRFVVLSFADAETGVVSEPRIHPYLAKGRQIILEINHNPIVSWFKANDGSTKCEIRLGILPGVRDTIRLLGKKEAMSNLTIPESPDTQTESIPGVDNKLLIMKAELDKLIAAQSKSTVSGQKPAFNGITAHNVSTGEHTEYGLEEKKAVHNAAQFDGIIIEEAEDINPF